MLVNLAWCRMELLWPGSCQEAVACCSPWLSLGASEFMYDAAVWGVRDHIPQCVCPGFHWPCLVNILGNLQEPIQKFPIVSFARVHLHLHGICNHKDVGAKKASSNGNVDRWECGSKMHKTVRRCISFWATTGGREGCHVHITSSLLCVSVKVTALKLNWSLDCALHHLQGTPVDTEQCRRHGQMVSKHYYLNKHECNKLEGC